MLHRRCRHHASRNRFGSNSGKKCRRKIRRSNHQRPKSLVHSQLVPEFFRNFIKMEPRPTRLVNYCFFSILLVRTIWLIASTVIVTQVECEHINYAWVSIYVNWGIFGSTFVIVSIIIIVRVIQARRSTQL